MSLAAFGTRRQEIPEVSESLVRVRFSASEAPERTWHRSSGRNAESAHRAEEDFGGAGFSTPRLEVGASAL